MRQVFKQLLSCCINSWRITTSSCSHLAEERPEDDLLQGISTLKACGPHAIQGERGKVKTPLTNLAINHLAVSVTVTHSCQKLNELTQLCKLLCCYKITLPPSQHRHTCSNIATLWDTVCLFLALAISVWLLPRTPLHLRACRLPAVTVEIHYRNE